MKTQNGNLPQKNALYSCFKMKNAKNAEDQFIKIQHFVFNFYLTVSIWEPADNLCSTVI